MNKKTGLTKRLTALLLAVVLLMAQAPVVLAEGFSIQTNLTGLSYSGSTELEEGVTYFTGKLALAEGYPADSYRLPDSVTVTGGTLSSYDASTGVLSVTDVTGDVSITAVAVPTFKTVTWNLTGLTAGETPPETVHDGEALSAKLALDEEHKTGYRLPQSITVTIGGESYTNGYNAVNGVLDILADDITGDVSITASAVSLTKSITWDLKNIKEPETATVAEDASISVELEPDENYRLPAKESITVTGGTIESYDAKTGALSVKCAKQDGDTVSITAAGVQLYKVSVAEASTATLSTDVTEAAAGDKVSVTVEGRGEHYVPTVKYNDMVIPKAQDGSYSFPMPADDVELSHSWTLTDGGNLYTLDESNIQTIGVKKWTRSDSITISPVDPAKKVKNKGTEVTKPIELSEGENVFTLTVEDGDGLSAAAGTLTIWRDTTPPTAPKVGNYGTMTDVEPVGLWTNKVNNISVTIDKTSVSDAGVGMASVNPVQYVILHTFGEEKRAELNTLVNAVDRDEQIETYLSSNSEAWTAFETTKVNVTTFSEYGKKLTIDLKNAGIYGYVYVVAKAEDALGNVSYAYSPEWWVDMTAPEPELQLSNNAGENMQVEKTGDDEYLVAGDLTLRTIYRDTAGGVSYYAYTDPVVKPSTVNVTIYTKPEEGDASVLEGEGLYSLTAPADWIAMNDAVGGKDYSVGTLVVNTSNAELFPDGDYVLVLKVTDFSNNEGSCAVKITVDRSTAPGINIDYGGYTGYDWTKTEGEGEAATTTTSYLTAAGASDSLSSATIGGEVESNSGVSDKLFYLKEGAEFTLALSSDETLSKSEAPWSFTLTKKGSSNSLAGAKLKKDDDGKYVITVETASLSEGEYTLTVTAKGLSGQTSSYTVNFVVDKTAPAVDTAALKYATRQSKDDPFELKPFAEWIAYDANAERYIFLPKDAITESALDQVYMAYNTEPLASIEAKTEGENKGWFLDISGEYVEDSKPARFNLEVGDKAGNRFVLTTGEGEAATNGADILLDGSDPTIGALRLYNGNEDLEDAISMLSFGILSPNKTVVTASIEDTGSGLAAEEYAFIFEKDCTAAEKEEDKSVADKFFEALKDPSTAAKTLKELTEKNKNKIEWTELDTESVTIDGKNYFSTAAQSTNGKMIAVFRAVDKVGHESYKFQCYILDDQLPYVSKLEIGGSQTENIFIGETTLTFTVEDTVSPGVTSGGLKSISYQIFAGTEPFANAVTVYSDNAVPALRTSYIFTVTIPVAINSTRVHVVVEMEDACGNIARYDTNPAEGEENTDVEKMIDPLGYLNIDGTAPTVEVVFDSLRDRSSGYYYEDTDATYYAAPRSAQLRILDNNFDAEGVQYNNDRSGEEAEAGFDSPTMGDDGRYADPFTLDFSFSEGEHRFVLNSVKDKVGLQAAEIRYIFMDGEQEVSVEDYHHFFVDTGAPTLTLTAGRADAKPFGGEYANCSMILTAKCSDENLGSNTLKVSGAQESTHAVGEEASFTFIPDGRYEFLLTGSDRAGNAAEQEETYFIVDTEAPEISITGVENQSANRGESIIPVVTVTDTNYSAGDVDVTLTGYANGEVYYDSTGRLFNGEVYTYENVEEDDMYVLKVTAKDQAENESTETLVFSVNRNGSVFTLGDTLQKAKDGGMEYFNAATLPPVEVLETNVDIITKAQLYLTFGNSTLNLKEGKDYLTARQDVKGGWNQYCYTLDPALFAEDGVYRISLMTEDRAGNTVNKESFYSCVIDNTAPVIVTVDLESGVTYNEESRTVSFLPKDNIALRSVEVLLNGEQVGFWDGETVNTLSDNGEGFRFVIPESNSRQSVRILCTDMAGNVNEDQLIDNFFVTTNIFIRFFNNKPLFFGSIGGVGLLTALILGAKKKKKGKKA